MDDLVTAFSSVSGQSFGFEEREIELETLTALEPTEELEPPHENLESPEIAQEIFISVQCKHCLVFFQIPYLHNTLHGQQQHSCPCCHKPLPRKRRLINYE